jgi:hypothetical protein
MAGSATFTTVESRNTIPEPRTAAMRTQRLLTEQLDAESGLEGRTLA